jgi:hypothetical protein
MSVSDVEAYIPLIVDRLRQLDLNLGSTRQVPAPKLSTGEH